MELMLVIGMIAIVAAIIIVAVNPSKQLSDTRDSKRRQELRELENALEQYIIDGNSITGINSGLSNATNICQDTLSQSSCSGTGFYMGYLLPDYIVNIPVDPDATGSLLTNYYIYKSGSFNEICSPQLTTGCGG